MADKTTTPAFDAFRLQLQQKSLAELVALHNGLFVDEPEKHVTIKTFASRGKAMDRIEKVMMLKGMDPGALDGHGRTNRELKEVANSTPPLSDDAFEKDVLGQPDATQVLADEVGADDPTDEEIDESNAEPTHVDPPEDVAPVVHLSVRSIRAAAEELLAQKEPPLSYQEILDLIHSEFPLGATSVACLRWYAVRMREKGIDVPARPLPPRVGGKAKGLTDEEKLAKQKKRQEERDARAKAKAEAKAAKAKAKAEGKATKETPEDDRLHVDLNAPPNMEILVITEIGDDEETVRLNGNGKYDAAVMLTRVGPNRYKATCGQASSAVVTRQQALKWAEVYLLNKQRTLGKSKASPFSGN